MQAINLPRQRSASSNRAEIDRALAAMEPISLDEMDGVRLLNRVDTKYAMQEAQVAMLLDAVAADYRVLEVDGAKRTSYSTLYFDTLSLDCYRDHHNGRSQRYKFRMRSYGPAGPAFFEVKQKTNKGRTIKQRLPIPVIRQALDAESAAMAESVAGRSLELVPTIWTTFSRITLVNYANAERVTLDIDLEFRDAHNRSAAFPGIAIVEVKQHRESRYSSIRRQLRELRVPPLRISKYCIASVLLDPSLKYNRFKPNLLALETLSQ